MIFDDIHTYSRATKTSSIRPPRQKCTVYEVFSQPAELVESHEPANRTAKLCGALFLWSSASIAPRAQSRAPSLTGGDLKSDLWKASYDLWNLERALNTSLLQTKLNKP